MIFLNAAATDSGAFFEGLENQLFASFRPVEPDPQFVNRLKHRLTTPPEVYLEERRKRVSSFLVISMGLVGTAFIAWLLHRLFSSED